MNKRQNRETVKHNPDDMLMQVLGFDKPALTLNRAGQLSPQQTERLRREVSKQRALIFRVMFLGSAVAAVAGLVDIVWGLFILLGAGLGVTGLLVEMIMLRYRLAANPPVREEAGIVRLRSQTVKYYPRKRTWFFVQVNNRHFRTTEDVMLAFREGDAYRVYYVGSHIVSAERLTD